MFFSKPCICGTLAVLQEREKLCILFGFKEMWNIVTSSRCCRFLILFVVFWRLWAFLMKLTASSSVLWTGRRWHTLLLAGSLSLGRVVSVCMSQSNETWNVPVPYGHEMLWLCLLLPVWITFAEQWQCDSEQECDATVAWRCYLPSAGKPSYTAIRKQTVLRAFKGEKPLVFLNPVLLKYWVHLLLC